MVVSCSFLQLNSLKILIFFRLYLFFIWWMDVLVLLPQRERDRERESVLSICSSWSLSLHISFIDVVWPWPLTSAMRREPDTWKPSYSTTRSQPRLRITQLESTALLPVHTFPLTPVRNKPLALSNIQSPDNYYTTPTATPVNQILFSRLLKETGDFCNLLPAC